VFVRTPLGRARAWLRLALMQKKLADYLRLLITRKDILRFVFFPLNSFFVYFVTVVVGRIGD